MLTHKGVEVAVIPKDCSPDDFGPILDVDVLFFFIEECNAEADGHHLRHLVGGPNFASVTKITVGSQME